MTSRCLANIEIKVPGKIMFAGEYAVLKGGRSLSAAVDAWMSLTVKPSESEEVLVHSNIWPEAKRLDHDSSEPLLDALRSIGLTHAHVHVKSEFDVSFGLGSSSAVRLAAHLVGLALQSNSPDTSTYWNAAREAWMGQEKAQGFASGYDFVTQTEGGVVLWQPDYKNWPGQRTRLDLKFYEGFVHAYIGGRGAPTKSVGGGVRSYLDQRELWPSLMEANENLVSAFLSQDTRAIFNANKTHRSLFAEAPFYPSRLGNLLASIKGFDRSWSFKTTGAGGEDALLLLGEKDGDSSALQAADEALRLEGWRPLPFAYSAKGCHMRRIKEVGG